MAEPQSAHCTRARKWLSSHFQPYVAVFSSKLTQAKMEENNGLTPAEFLRPFGEVGNLSNVSVHTVDKNTPYKLNRFRVNFIDSSKMWSDPKQSDSITQKIVNQNRPKVRSDIAETMPTTKEKINEKLLEMIEHTRASTERERTPWFTQLKQQFYQSNRFATHELTQQPIAFIYFLSVEERDPLSTIDLLRTVEHLPHQYRSGAYDNSKNSIKTFVFILNDTTDDRRFDQIKDQISGQFNEKCIVKINMSVPKQNASAPAQVPGDLWGSYRELDLRSFDKTKIIPGKMFTQNDRTIANQAVRRIVEKELLPFTRLRIKNLEELCARTRKGFTNKVFRAFKGPERGEFDGTKGNFRMNKSDLELRNLIDLAFVIQDYETTYGNAEYPASDFRKVNALTHMAHCEELKLFSRIAYEKFYAQSNFKDVVGTAHQIYSTYSKGFNGSSSLIRFSLMMVELFQLWGEHQAAADFFIKIATMLTDNAILKPMFFEQAAYEFLMLQQFRKFAFYMNLAGQCFERVNLINYAFNCFTIVLPYYQSHKGWNKIQLKLYNQLGENCQVAQGNTELAAQFFRNLLQLSHQVTDKNQQQQCIQTCIDAIQRFQLDQTGSKMSMIGQLELPQILPHTIEVFTDPEKMQSNLLAPWKLPMIKGGTYCENQGPCTILKGKFINFNGEKSKDEEDLTRQAQNAKNMMSQMDNKAQDINQSNIPWKILQQQLIDQMRKHHSWSDERGIGVHVWQKLKVEAMKDDYKESKWYSKLKEKEIILLEKLRNAQEAQGNMNPLSFKPDDVVDTLHEDAYKIGNPPKWEVELWDATCQKERSDVTFKQQEEWNQETGKQDKVERKVFKEKAILMRLIMRNPLLIEVPITKVRLQCHIENEEGVKQDGDEDFDATYTSIEQQPQQEKGRGYKVQHKDINLKSKQEQEVILKVSPLKEGTIVIDKLSWEIFGSFKCEYEFMREPNNKIGLPKQLEEKKKIFSYMVMPHSAEVEAEIELQRNGLLQSDKDQSRNLVYTETDKGFFKIKNTSRTYSIKNIFVLCSHPIIFNFRIRQITNGNDHLLGPGEDIQSPINFRAAIKDQFCVRFLIKYEVSYNNMTQEEMNKIPITCRHRFQRLIVHINSNFAFNMKPQVHMSVLEPNQYLINLQTLQNIASTWYEKPQIVSIEAIKGAQHWILQKKDAKGNFFIMKPRKGNSYGATDEVPDAQLCYEDLVLDGDFLDGLGGGAVNQFSLRKDSVAFGQMIKESDHVEFFGGKKKQETLGHESEFADLIVRWKMPKLQKAGFFSLFGVHLLKKKKQVTKKTSEAGKRRQSQMLTNNYDPVNVTRPSEKITPIAVTFTYPQVTNHHFSDDSPSKVITLTLTIQNLLQTDECQFDCEVAATQNWSNPKSRVKASDVSEGESFLWLGKTTYVIKHLKPNEIRKVVLRACVSHEGIFNLNRFQINIKQVKINSGGNESKSNAKAKESLITEFRLKDLLMAKVVDNPDPGAPIEKMMTEDSPLGLAF